MKRPSLACRIQHHPSRADLLPALLKSLEPLPVEVSTHASEPPNPWAGYEQALRDFLLRSEESHCVLLQDDVVVCFDFPSRVQEVVEERPDSVVSLWVGGLRSKTMVDYLEALKGRERWSPVFFSDIHHCVALAWPRALAREFLEWTETSRLPGEDRPQQSDDAIVGAWARRTHHLFWATIPSLVEHLDHVPSTIGRPQGGKDRRAIAFAGTDSCSS